MPATPAAPNKTAETIQEDTAGFVEVPPHIIPPVPFIEEGAFTAKKYTPTAMSMRMQLSDIVRTTI